MDGIGEAAVAAGIPEMVRPKARTERTILSKPLMAISRPPVANNSLQQLRCRSYQGKFPHERLEVTVVPSIYNP